MQAKTRCPGTLPRTEQREAFGFTDDDETARWGLLPPLIRADGDLGSF